MADHTRRVSSAGGLVTGRYKEEAMVCQYVHMTNSQGCSWFGCDPFSYTLPVLLAQFVLIFLLTRTTYFFLKPLKQSLTTAQILAGIIMGQSILSHDQTYGTKLFPPGGKVILETVAEAGFMFYIFILGVQIDTTLVMQTGKNAVLIGTTGYILPYALGALTILAIPNLIVLDNSVTKSLQFIASLNSMSTFPVITSLLADLKILNSELGRLATSTSMISNIWSYIISVTMGTVAASITYSEWKPLWNIICIIFYIILILFVLRPLILQIARKIPEGQTMKENQFLAILIVVLLSGFFSEVLGQPAGLGTFILGMSVPDGPPLGAALVHKLEVFSTGMLVPAKVVIGGLSVDLFSVGRRSWSSGVIIEIVIILGYVGKFTGTLISALYCSVPFWEAVSLALVMCCQGIIELSIYMTTNANGTINNEEYALLIITMLIVTGIATPLVWYLYDPSRRYLAYTRNSIFHSLPDSELRMLVCIHNEDNVPTIINLLQASNPARNRPISVFVLNLTELTARSTSLFIPNFLKGNTSASTRSEHIVNAFNFFTQRNQGFVTVQHFTAIAPYTSMDDDICAVAIDKNVTIVIVPFHKQWEIDGTVENTFSSIRAVNENVIRKSPCSVGILVDRGQMGCNLSVVKGKSLFRITMLFVGGADDREALAYSSRMAEHPHISLTLVWLRPRGDKKYSNKLEMLLDSESINQFRSNAMGKERISYKEEMVRDAVGTTRVLRDMEDSCDLFIVGRHHEHESPLTSGLTEWSECPELGVIGDMLATMDFRFSVLVVQQQPTGHGFRDNNAGRSMACGLVVDSRVYQDPWDEDDRSQGPIRSV